MILDNVSYGPASGRSWQVSPQRIDPLGALGAWPFTVSAAVAGLGYALIQTLLQWPQVSDARSAIIALILAAAACIALVVGARPAQAPMRLRTTAIVGVLAVAAAVFEMMSRFGHNQLLQDDFGQLLVGLVLLSLAPYRPAVELVVASILGSAALIVITRRSLSYLFVHSPWPEYTVVTVVPVLALGLAGAAFSNQLVRAVQHWQRAAARTVLASDLDSHEGVARSVQQNQVTLLSQDVLPFLQQVVAARELAAGDNQRAAVLAGALRGTLVEDLDRTWLDELSDRQRRRGGTVPSIDDPERLAVGMSAEQRSGCTALIVALCAPETLEVASVAVTLRSRGDGRIHAEIAYSTSTQPRVIRHTARSFLAVMRVLFDGVRVAVDGETRTLGFDYVPS